MEGVFRTNFDKIKTNKEELCLFRKRLKCALVEPETENTETASLKRTSVLIRRMKELNKTPSSVLLWNETKILKLERHTDDLLNALRENSFEDKTVIYLCMAIVSFLNKKYPGTADAFVNPFLSQTTSTAITFLCEMSLVGLIDSSKFTKVVFDFFKQPKQIKNKTELLLFMVKEWNEELFCFNTSETCFSEPIRKQFLALVHSFIQSRRKRLEYLNKKSFLSEEQQAVCNKDKIINERFVITKTLSLLCPLLGIDLHIDQLNEQIDRKPFLRKWTDEDERSFYEDVAVIEETKGDLKKQFEVSKLKIIITKEELDKAALLFLSTETTDFEELTKLLTNLKEIKKEQFSLYCRFLKIINHRHPALIGSLCGYIEKMLWTIIQKNIHVFIKEKTIKYLTELIRFDLIHSNFFYPPLLYCLKNINKKTLSVLHDVCLSCGRFLANNPQTENLIEKILDTLQLELDKHLEAGEEKMSVLNIRSVFVKENEAFIPQKRFLEGEYIDRLLTVELQEMDQTELVSKELRKLDWTCKKTTEKLYKRLTRPWELGSVLMHQVTDVLSKLAEYYPDFVSNIIDSVFEEVLYQTTLDIDENKQALFSSAEYLGEFYVAGFISLDDITQTISKTLRSGSLDSFKTRIGLILIKTIDEKARKDGFKPKEFIDLILNCPKNMFSIETLLFMENVLNRIIPGCYKTEIGDTTEAIASQQKVFLNNQKTADEEFENKLKEAVLKTACLNRRREFKLEIYVPLQQENSSEKEGEYTMLFKKENKRKTKTVLIDN